MPTRRIRTVFRHAWVRIGASEAHPLFTVPVPLGPLAGQAFLRHRRRFAKDDSAHDGFSCFWIQTTAQCRKKYTAEHAPSPVPCLALTCACSGQSALSTPVCPAPVGAALARGRCSA